LNRTFLHTILFATLLVLSFVPYRVFSTRFLDEGIALILFCMLTTTAIQKRFLFSIKTFLPFLVVIIVFVVYFIQSAFWGGNTFSAILYDALVQFKPYVGFFSVLLLVPHFNEKQRKCLKYISFIVIAYGLVAAMLGGGVLTGKYYGIWLLTEHPARFAFLFTICAFIFIWTSEWNKQNILIFFVILAVGLLSGRSKMYGFFTFSIFIWLYYFWRKEIHFKKTDLVLIFIAVVSAFIVSYSKIEAYFLNEEVLKLEYMDSRKVLYSTAFQVANDNFPLGNGLGSFGTNASIRILSPIYEQYGIATNTNGKLSICVCDSLFAAILAQFGYLGVCLFFLFWIYILRKIYLLSVKNNNNKLFIIGISIVAFFIIETFSDSTFTQNRGLLMMMFLAFIISDLKHKTKQL